MTTHTPDGITLTSFQALALASKAIGHKVILPSGGVCEGVIVEDGCVMVKYRIAPRKTSHVLIFEKGENGVWKMSKTSGVKRDPTFRELRDRHEADTKNPLGGGRPDGRGSLSAADSDTGFDIQNIEAVLRARDKRLGVEPSQHPRGTGQLHLI